MIVLEYYMESGVLTWNDYSENNDGALACLGLPEWSSQTMWL